MHKYEFLTFFSPALYTDMYMSLQEANLINATSWESLDYVIWMCD